LNPLLKILEELQMYGSSPIFKRDVIVASDKTFNITLQEAKALIKLLSSEYIPKEPYDEYEQIMRLINGLGNFIDTHTE
jgi:type III secretion system FlhB-like substrate exporter